MRILLSNLKAEMARCNISYEDLGSVIGKNNKTVYNRLSGQTQFTCAEMFDIQAKLFPQHSLEYLFAKEKQSA